MIHATKAVCAINDCGKPFAPLDKDLPKEEDYFRMCVKHEKILLESLRKLRGDW